MRFILLLVVVFSVTFYLFESSDVRLVRNYNSIAESPGFTQGTVDRITKVSEKRGREWFFRVYFKYEVGGVSYSMGSSGKSYRSNGRNAEPSSELYKLVDEIVYDTRNPSLAMMRQDYDHKRRDPPTVKTRSLSGIASVLVVALTITLVIARRFGWLGQKKYE